MPKNKNVLTQNSKISYRIYQNIVTSQNSIRSNKCMKLIVQLKLSSSEYYMNLLLNKVNNDTGFDYSYVNWVTKRLKILELEWREMYLLLLKVLSFLERNSLVTDVLGGPSELSCSKKDNPSTIKKMNRPTEVISSIICVSFMNSLPFFSIFNNVRHLIAFYIPPSYR